MRFLSLQLCPFGVFDDLTYDFSGDDAGGLHLVHGPNGAGKSTTLRAIRSSLYGMPSATDTFGRESSSLRLKAHLRRENGDEIQYARRIARQKPLWDLADEAQIDVGDLKPFLGGFSLQQFQTLYGLDHATLVAGGHELLTGDGDLGQDLYTAGLGGPALAATVKRLDGEIGDLWGPRSSSATINRLLAELKDVDASLKDETRRASVNAHDKNRRELKKAMKLRAEGAASRQPLIERIQELGALQRALPVLARIDAAMTRQAELGDLAPLSPDQAAEFRSLIKERRALAEARTKAEADDKRRDAEIERLGAIASPDLLGAAREIRDLGMRLGGYRSALEQVERSERDRDAAQARLADIQVPASPGGEPGSSVDEALDVDDARAALVAHAAARKEARGDLQRAQEQRKTALAELNAAEREAGSLPQDPALQLELVNLAPFAGTLEELGSLAVPHTSDVEARATAEAQAAADAKDLARRMADARSRLAQAEADEERLVRAGEGGAPPTPEELQALRDRRDAGWRELTASADAGDPAAPGAVRAVELQIAECDLAADRLRSEADRAHALSDARRQRVAGAETLGTLQAEAGTAEAAQSAATSAWIALWSPSGFAPASGAAMLDWIRRREALLARVADRRAASSRSLQEATAAVTRADESLEAAKAALEQADERWRTWAKGLGFDPDAGEERAAARLDALGHARRAAQDLERLIPEAERLRSTVDDFERDTLVASDRFHIAVAPGVTTEERLAAVTAALEAANRAASEQTQLAHERTWGQGEAAQREADQARVDAALQAMCEASGDPTLDALGERAELSGQLQALAGEIKEARAKLVGLGPGWDEDKARSALSQRSPESLAEELGKAEAEREALDASIDAASEQIGLLNPSVSGQGSSRGAELLEDRSRIVAALAEATETLARTRLARALLDQEIRRYQEENQGPLLKRAGELLERLTLGAYVGLVAAESDQGQPVMKAKRRHGGEVQVTGTGRSRDKGVGTSTGTQDQLFLALRIATVEQMIETAEPMPFIADDLFVNFDDARTEAALGVLCDLAHKTQVIVFSHHEAVRQQAETMAASGQPIRVHRLVGESQRASKGLTTIAGPATD